MKEVYWTLYELNDFMAQVTTHNLPVRLAPVGVAKNSQSQIPGSGGVPGTLKHSAAFNEIRQQYPEIRVNQYFSSPDNTIKGFIDALDPKTMTIYDFKFGNASMGATQGLKYMNFYNVDKIVIIRPSGWEIITRGDFLK